MAGGGVRAKDGVELWSQVHPPVESRSPSHFRRQTGVLSAGRVLSVLCFCSLCVYVSVLTGSPPGAGSRLGRDQ